MYTVLIHASSLPYKLFCRSAIRAWKCVLLPELGLGEPADTQLWEAQGTQPVMGAQF